MMGTRFLRENAAWLAAGLLLSFASSFGQTFFISLFGAQYRAALGMSHGEFGTIYMCATLLSAAVLVRFGGIVDRWTTRQLGAATLLALSLVCIAMAGVGALWQFFLIVFGLRFLGQGMLSHIKVTAVARWFAASRGKALAVAGWGHPLGEGILPMIVAALLAVMSWRSVWLLCAGLLLLGLLPLFLTTLRRERVPQGSETAAARILGLGGRHWTRREVLRHRLFWLLFPALMASPLIGTAALFHQAHIVEIKGWTLAQFTAGFPVYAVLSVAFSLLFGALVDRFSARTMLPFYLLPLACGMIILGHYDAPWAAIAALGGIGASAGAGMTTTSAMWAELYGTRHLGAIRSLSAGAMVFATAIGPGATGMLIDAGVGFETQCIWMGVICLVMAAWMTALMRQSWESELVDNPSESA